jgi:hypothetical protein
MLQFVVRTLECKFMGLVFGAESEIAAGREKITGTRKNT